MTRPLSELVDADTPNCGISLFRGSLPLSFLHLLASITALARHDSYACVHVDRGEVSPAVDDISNRAVSQKTFAGPTRAFALPGLRADAAYPSLDV